MGNARQGGAVKRFFVLPDRVLQAYVDRLWGWESDALAGLPPLLPGTGAELMFHYGVPPVVRNCHKEALGLGPAFLLCSRSGPHFAEPVGALGFISVRFRSGALRHFCGFPLSEITQDALPIGEVWGKTGRDLAEKVALAPDNASRVAMIEAWLMDCLQQHAKDQPRVEQALLQLYYHHREVKVESLADELGMSKRNFERVFRLQIGLSPKSFQRAARLNQTVRDLLLCDRHDYLGVALDHGYYDQAHFIHDFQFYVGESPSSFLEQRMRLAHFYNPPLFTPDKVPSIPACFGK